MLCIVKAQHHRKLPLSDAIRRFGRNQPHPYRIVVEGALAAHWSDRLGGMRIESLPGDGSRPTVTVLEGLIQDQAQLSGVLNTLCDLRHPLLGVELIDDDIQHNALDAIQKGERS